MLKKLFAVAMSGALLFQNTTLLLAESEEGEEEVSGFIYGVEETDAKLPITYHTNDIPSGDEGTYFKGIKVTYHSVNTINNYLVDHTVEFLNADYAAEPSTVSPFAAGSLSDTVLNDALKTVNLIRFIAGLDDVVTLNPDFSKEIQAGALINAMSNSLINTIPKPDDMDSDLYQLGCTGNTNAILSDNNSSLANTIIREWLDGSNDPETLKGRRWLLNATMGQTGFGQVGSYSGMYAKDTTHESDKTSCLWPAQNTPVEYFSSNSPWSISTGNSETLSEITVTMLNLSNNNETVFSKAVTPDLITVNNDTSYGVPGTVIWRPQGISCDDGDCYRITITGLVGGEVNYTVKFFDLDTTPRIEFNPSSLVLDVGESKTATFKIKHSTSDDYINKVTRGAGKYIEISSTSNANEMKITGLKPGNTFAKVYSVNNLYARLDVLVKGITLSPESGKIHRNETLQLTANLFLEDTDDKTVTWISSNSAIASVDSNGLVTGGKNGTATITATVGSYSASCTVTVSNVDLQQASVTLTGYIGVNFMFDIPEDELNDTYIVLSPPNREAVTYAAKDADTYPGTGLLYFTADVSAKEMRDNILVNVVNEAGESKYFEAGGVDLTEGFNYTVENYFNALRRSNTQPAKLMALIEAMDTYGKYSQKYFEYNTGTISKYPTLANISETDLNNFNASLSGTANGITVTDQKLVLEEDTGIRLTFKLDSGRNIGDYIFKVNGEAASVSEAGENLYVLTIRGTAAKDLDKKFEISMTDGDGIEQILTYYPLTYVSSVLRNSRYNGTTLAEVCKALYWYWDAAEKYFGSN